MTALDPAGTVAELPRGSAGAGDHGVRRRVWAALMARDGDIARVVVALVLGGAASDATDVATGPYAEVNELVGLVAVLATWWGRRAPVTVAGLTFAASAISVMAGGAAVVSIYAVAAHHRGRVPIVLPVLYVVAGIISVQLFPDDSVGTTGNLVLGVAVAVAAIGWGLAVRARHDLMDAMAERVRRAEADQDARTAEARRAERTRIAAEMHDVLAHRLSMLSLHAGAVEHRPHSDPEDLARSVGVIRSNAHLALEELRGVIGLLRDEDDGDLTPPPTLADLEALLAECREAGMEIDVTLTPSVTAGLPADISRVAFRAVQEGLTNARKHAPQQPARLHLTGQAGEGLTIQVSNPCAAPPPEAAAIPSTGVGLIGLAERVHVAGGDVEALTADDVHRLRVWLPWPT